MKTKLTIVILNYIATHVTIDCLYSLSRCNDLQINKIKVVVWENGSGADATRLLRETIDTNQWQAWVELLTSPRNLGFTGGNNRVIERALQDNDAPEYFLLLNSDTLVSNNSITSLLDFMDSHPTAGIAGSQLLTLEGDHQCSPFRFPGIASEFDRGLKLGIVSRLLARWAVAMPVPDHEASVDWVSGASMLLRRTMLEQIGLLDEGFFTYFEDVDLCQRAHRAGWEVWYVPESRVIHLEGASSGIGSKIIKRRPRFWFQARGRYFLKNKGVYSTMIIDAVYILGFALWRVRRYFQQKPDVDPSNMLFDSIRNSIFFQGTTIMTVMNPSAQPKSGQFMIEHLLVLPVPFRQQGNELLIEAQAHHGLLRWLDNFETLALAAPLIPEYLAEKKIEIQWVKPDQVIVERVKFVPLPWAYRPDLFLRFLPASIRLLDPLIRESRYLQFAISGLWGDWASVAAELATKQNRPYAVHTDNVCHELILTTQNNLGFLKWLRARLDSPIMKVWNKRIIGKCSLGLFHGMDTYQVYKNWMPKGKCAVSVHDIHDIPVQDEFTTNNNRSGLNQFHIVYAGRFAPEKAPLDWGNALNAAHSNEAKFKATWAGDGPLFSEFQRFVQDKNLSEIITLPGFISDRKEIANLLKSADLFLFTHITPESPRCLIEALRFGVPIIGYDSAYAREIIEKHGGGVLVPGNDWCLLAKEIIYLLKNPSLITKLKENAIKDGGRFTSSSVFLERSQLIKNNL